MTTTKEQLELLRELRRRVHAIATGAEYTKNDNEALILICDLCEKTYKDAQ